MIESNVLLAFFTTSVILALSPGPDNLFVLAQSAQNGRMAGWFVTLGLATGLIGHTIAVAFGLAAIVHSSALAFSILKYMGAAYLLYLAWQAFRAAALTGQQEPVQLLSKGNLYRRGIVMNLTNPKVSLFFMAFLPQFADPNHGSMMAQFFLLGAVFIVATIFVFGLISILAGGFGDKFRNSPIVQKTVNRIAAAVFIGLAIKLAFSER
ncbi:MAG: LysE family translocator [Chlorobiaceae bacterium]|nr:LysE family translocator [Chlorobiaceae bacterium]NTV17256.1 LysE family translocator [Chlorobiaceae bacterium]